MNAQRPSANIAFVRLVLLGIPAVRLMIRQGLPSGEHLGYCTTSIGPLSCTAGSGTPTPSSRVVSVSFSQPGSQKKLALNKAG